MIENSGFEIRPWNQPLRVVGTLTFIPNLYSGGRFALLKQIPVSCITQAISSRPLKATFPAATSIIEGLKSPETVVNAEI